MFFHSSKRFFLLTAIILSAGVKVCADNWMSRLDDSQPLSLLTIPGAHDAATGCGFTGEYAALGEKFGTTQALTLAEQWTAGVRAFDLRPAVADNEGKAELHIYHGRMKTKAAFEYALILLIDSVKANPSEFAVVIMQHERGGDNGNEQWVPMMNTLMNKANIKNSIAEYSPALTVKDLRGKVLVLSRDSYADVPVGGYIEKWTSEDDLTEQLSVVVKSAAGRGSMYVQDYYETIGNKMDIKKENIRRMFAISCMTKQKTLNAKQSANTQQLTPNTNNPTPNTQHPIIVNHTSGYSSISSMSGYEMAETAGYRDNAAHCNAVAIKCLRSCKHAAGIIMMDYAGADKAGRYKVKGGKLVKEIISHNFK
jgi:hypothetical protein